MSALTPNDDRAPEERRKHWKKIALLTCEQGLEDNLVHTIFQYDLQKRLIKLERQLKIAKRFQHDFGHARLAKPLERTVYGIQIEKRRPSRGPAPLRRNSSVNEEKKTAGSSNVSKLLRTDSIGNNSGKTVWVDPLESNGECSVEAMSLSHYRSSEGGGWKGYHTEGGLVRTLFALLFYDVLFTYVPNVFQTPFQTCPLDLHTDAFYPTRASEVNARLAQIANGEGERILTETWEREVERKTCVVGLDWSFEISDLREIVWCMGGEGLSVVMKVLCQEYGERGGGMPDLFIWRALGGKRGAAADEAEPTKVNVDEDSQNFSTGVAGKDGEPNEGECRFVEVKSENDRLSDTQRLWIHVLCGAGFQVELCHALAREVQVSST